MNNLNTTIKGESHLSGGGYGKIKIMGSAWAKEDLTAEEIRVLGTAEFAGLQATKVNISGNARFEGPLSVGSATIAGSADALATVKAKEIKVYGSLTAKEEVSAESFVATGALDLASLNANDVTIKVAETARIGEIGAESVRVEPVSVLRFSFFGPRAKTLWADSIEADRIELSHTAARSVKGKQVSIGPACEIESVEYTDTLEIAPGAIVRSLVKVG